MRGFFPLFRAERVQAKPFQKSTLADRLPILQSRAPTYSPQQPRLSTL